MTSKPGRDLWRNTLSQIPTLFGQICYLASLRDPNTGTYHHFGFAQRFSEEDAESTLRESHREKFAEWLALNLESQKADLEEYLRELQGDLRTVIQTWLQLAPYRNYIPADAREMERQLYISDFETVLELLRHDYDVASPDRDA